MEKLQPGLSYHIFNHANGFEDVFCNDENYWFFLDKYRKHISPVAETYAWCLMPNHFHLVIRIRKHEVIEELIRNKSNSDFTSSNNFTNPDNFSKVSNFGKVKVKFDDDKTEKFLSKQFANLFSAYTQAFNKVSQRKGSLFIKNFKRELITCKAQFIRSVVYVHRNPVHHGFCQAYDDWPYSSYYGILNNDNTGVENAKVLAVFGGRSNFIEAHIESLKTLPPNIFEIP